MDELEFGKRDFTIGKTDKGYYKFLVDGEFLIAFENYESLQEISDLFKEAVEHFK